ncbi:hypothetical protein L1049_017589 [Liquidambar formosana]|uniref:Uncharacterized protein n=1 Tax=Liquidambar formosana TaxID=63359 RepID=A0AAP0S136_LIQFO
MTPDLEAIGREIVKKCARVPLAAKVLGGIMCSKKEKDEWLSIQNNKIWELPEDQNRILPALKLSFNHLPSPSLKQCFAYCSVFSKDLEIEKDRLIQLWMAQGLLRPSQEGIWGFGGDKFPPWMTVNTNGSSSLLPLSNLLDIVLYRCKKCDHIPMLGHLPCLKSLWIDGMANVKSIGAEFYGYNHDDGTSYSATRPLFPALKTFRLRCMDNLVEWMLAAGVVFPCLEELSLSECPQLTIAPSHFPYLRDLSIHEINSSTPLANICSNLTTLMSLEIYESDLRELPSLSSPTIINCGKLEGLPEGLLCFPRLKSLEIGGFWEELNSFPNFDDILQLHQLRNLMLYGWPKLDSLPDQLQHLTALTFLSINNFDGLEALPEWLWNLSSLQHLSIESCKNLMYLPSLEAMRRLTKLDVLTIHKCPFLEERCVKESGPEWSKILHIPDVYC